MSDNEQARDEGVLHHHLHHPADEYDANDIDNDNDNDDRADDRADDRNDDPHHRVSARRGDEDTRPDNDNDDEARTDAATGNDAQNGQTDTTISNQTEHDQGLDRETDAPNNASTSNATVGNGKEPSPSSGHGHAESKSNDTDDQSSQQPSSHAAAAEPRAIFVGNFDPRSRSDDLDRLFSPFGTVKRVDLKRSYAFVFMMDEEGGRQAVEALDGRPDPHFAADRLLKVEWARGDGAIKRREMERRRSCQAPSDTLFVVNFDPRSMTREILHERFAPFGKVIRLDLQTRYAFIQYETVDIATAALKTMHGTRVDDRYLIVEYTIRPSGSGHSGGGAMSNSGRRGSGGGYQGYNAGAMHAAYPAHYRQPYPHYQQHMHHPPAYGAPLPPPPPTAYYNYHQPPPPPHHHPHAHPRHAPPPAYHHAAPYHHAPPPHYQHQHQPPHYQHHQNHYQHSYPGHPQHHGPPTRGHGHMHPAAHGPPPHGMPGEPSMPGMMGPGAPMTGGPHRSRSPLSRRGNGNDGNMGYGHFNEDGHEHIHNDHANNGSKVSPERAMNHNGHNGNDSEHRKVKRVNNNNSHMNGNGNNKMSPNAGRDDEHGHGGDDAAEPEWRKGKRALERSGSDNGSNGGSGRDRRERERERERERRRWSDENTTKNSGVKSEVDVNHEHERERDQQHQQEIDSHEVDALIGGDSGRSRRKSYSRSPSPNAKRSRMDYGHGSPRYGKADDGK